MYNKDVGNRKFMKELKNEKEYCSRVNLAMAIVTFPVSAQSTNLTENIRSPEKTSESGYDISELSLDNIPDELLTQTDLAEMIAEGTITDIESTDTEVLNSITVINGEGSRSTYSYSVPVKYIDEQTNQIKFIDNSLESGGIFDRTAYKNTDNSIKSEMPKKITDGIIVSENNNSIKILPQTENNVSAVKKEQDVFGNKKPVVEYENAFGQGISLQYEATNAGLKENVVISEKSDKNVFKFVLETHGLVPDTLCGQTIMFGGKDAEEPSFVLSAPWIKDSYNAEGNDEHISTESYYEITELSDGKYELALVADKTFLDSPDTVYPVVIDPPYATFGTSKINYVSLFSSSSERWYNSQYGMLGNQSGYGECLMYLQFPNVKEYKHLIPKSITRVTVNMYQSVGASSSYYIDCYDSNTSETASSVSYGTVNSNIGTQLDRTLCQGNATYGWWITGVFKDWLTYERSGKGWPKYQVILKAENGGNPFKQFLCSGNYMWVKIDYECTFTMIGIQDPSHKISHTAYMGKIAKYTSWYNCSIQRSVENCSATTALKHFESSTVLVFRGHGSRTSIGCYNSSLTNDTFSSKGSEYLANEKLIVLLACATAKGGEGAANFATTLNKKGAQTVVGFMDDIYCNEAEQWIEHFIWAAGLDRTVEEACEYANVETGIEKQSRRATVIGDKTQRAYQIS